jgi:hypothetical protein
MSDIALRTDQTDALAVHQTELYADANIARLVRWAEQADAAVRIADLVVNTSMCPRAYRGKRQEAAAAILAGAELNLNPMASLRAFDDIQGTPAPKAITLRAVVQARGHDLEIAESGPTRAIARGRRKGSENWQTVEWTIERATQAGYVAKNPRWKADPTAQLVARATAEMARWLDSAAIMGLPVSAEEIADTGAELASVTRRVTAADVVTAAVEHQAAIADPEQLDRIRNLFTDHGVQGGAQRLFVAEVIGHDLMGLNELTSDEADRVIAALHQLGEQP